MSDRHSLRGIAHERWKWISRGRPARAAIGLGAAVLALAALLLLFGAILNGYGKPRIERAFAAAHPGYTLRIGRLEYEVLTGRLTARSVTLAAPGTTLTVGRISLTGVSWMRLLRGTAALPDVLARASLDAAGLGLELAQEHYLIRCARLRASVPGSELTAAGIEVAPSAGDEVIFAESPFRTTRFRLSVPECRIAGLAFAELLRGSSYRARSVQLLNPSFNALSNRDKPAPPFTTSPLMVNEGLAAIPRPLQLDSLAVTNGHLEYCERVVAQAPPGVLTFTAVHIAATGITNRGGPPAAIKVAARGNLMDAGPLAVLMTIPLATSGFALHYSGTLGAMDLTRLDAFLDIVELTRIKSGRAQQASFEIDLAAGHASGRVRAVYSGLTIAVLDQKSGSEKGFGNRAASFMANLFSIRHSNARPASGPMLEGKVDYARKPGDTFLQVAWFSLRSGVLAVINR